ncbi:MAG: acyltransferase [Bacteroidetes bacterium]|nr:acyltransferase [Bacteroidota bacterium]
MKRIPSLDGFRAISIILIIVTHSRFSIGFPGVLNDTVRHGAFGVTVFFVISGFLITTLLLNEYSKYNDISIKSFYIRRAFRILPVFILYTLFVIIWQQFKDITIRSNDIYHALTFTFNFAPIKHAWVLGHFWTLSVEEQFYIIWPTIFLIFRKHLKLALCTSILYSCVVRVVAYKFPAFSDVSLAPFFSYSDSIAVGALGSIMLFENPAILELKIWKSYLLQITALVIIGLFVYCSDYGKGAKIALPFGNLLISISILFIIFAYIKPSKTLVFRILNSKAMIHIGLLSYSIYVWQQFFFINTINMIWFVFPYNIIMIYIISLASYYLFEKPCLKLKQLFSKEAALVTVESKL